MSSIFTKIIRGEVPCFKIAEDELCFAFLDISPLAKGHTLVIPKKEIDYIFDVDSPEYNHMWNFSKKIAGAIEKAINCKRIGIAVIGLEVPHAHIHLIPMNSVSDMNFANPKLRISDAEMNEIAERIRTELPAI
jgi:histidine triad (HIT) family protein